MSASFCFKLGTLFFSFSGKGAGAVDIFTPVPLSRRNALFYSTHGVSAIDARFGFLFPVYEQGFSFMYTAVHTYKG